jgi:CO/xanthine dehydrogenase FAD-binding subunit
MILWEEIMLQAIATPGSLAEAHAVLSRQPDARILGGGTALIPVLNYGTDDFTSLVSLRRAGLSGVNIKDRTATIGAATTLAELEDERDLAFLRPALDTIASPTIRNMATIGGNLFVKQPYGDAAACLIALDASATISDGSTTRIEPVERLVSSGVKAGEIVTQISFTLPAAENFKFAKAGRKALNAAAIVTVAAVIAITAGKVTRACIGLGGVAKHAVRASSVERALLGKPFDRSSVEAAARQAVNDIDPFDDFYASAWYRARVTPVHIRRALIGE